MERRVITVREIHVRPDRMRGLDEAKVRELAESIRKFGLLSPIGVCIRDNVEVEPGEFEDLVHVLVYGNHRLEALKLLGETKVEVNLHRDDDPHVEMLEIIENLHRNDLTGDDRKKHVKRLAELIQDQRDKNPSSQLGTPEIGYGKPPPAQKSIATEIAEKTGLARSTVHRILNDDKAELERQRQRENRQASKIDADVKARAAKEAAELIVEFVPGEWWDNLKSNLFAAGASSVAKELTNIIGNSVADRGVATR